MCYNLGEMDDVSEDAFVVDIPPPPTDTTTYTVQKLTYSDGRAYCYHVSDEAGRLCYVAERTGMLLPSRSRLVEFFDVEHSPVGRLEPPDVAPWLRGTRYTLFAAEGDEPYAVIRERWSLVDILLLRLPRYDVKLGSDRYVVRGSRYGARFYEIFWAGEEGEVDEADEGSGEEDGEEAQILETLADMGDAEGAEILDALSEAEKAERVEGSDEGEEQVLEALTEAEEGGDEIGEALTDLEESDEDEEAGDEEIKVGEIRRPTAGPSYMIEADPDALGQAPLLLAAVTALIDMELYS